ncbi:hypothetical protein MTO96_008984 [Rhipicephalus appendiculatus]
MLRVCSSDGLPFYVIGLPLACEVSEVVAVLLSRHFWYGRSIKDRTSLPTTDGTDIGLSFYNKVTVLRSALSTVIRLAPTCEVLIAGFLYIVDFEHMVQVRRNDFSRRRRVKRDLASVPKKGIAGIRLEEQAREGNGGVPPQRPGECNAAERLSHEETGSVEGSPEEDTSTDAFFEGTSVGSLRLDDDEDGDERGSGDASSPALYHIGRFGRRRYYEDNL